MGLNQPRVAIVITGLMILEAMQMKRKMQLLTRIFMQVNDWQLSLWLLSNSINEWDLINSACWFDWECLLVDGSVLPADE